MAISVKDLLEAGCHFGHQTKRWNPKMKDYVYGAKNGISIIDLTKTIRQIGDACNFLQREVMKGSRILFVGTKRQAQQVVRNAAEETEMFFMSERWMGGTLTNIETIRKSVKKMREIDDIVDEAERHAATLTGKARADLGIRDRDHAARPYRLSHASDKQDGEPSHMHRNAAQHRACRKHDDAHDVRFDVIERKAVHACPFTACPFKVILAEGLTLTSLL